jgi:hypothetical protein
MALSDSCFEFLQAVAAAAAQLGRDAHHYSDPQNPLRYGPEIDALRRACVAAVDAPYDPEAGARVLRLAASVMRFHDTPSGTDRETSLQAELDQLVHVIQTDLDPDDAAAVPAVIEQIAAETPFTGLATERLKLMLSKISKPAYDVAIKIIGDIGAATVKRMLGL